MSRLARKICQREAQRVLKEYWPSQELPVDAWAIAEAAGIRVELYPFPDNTSGLLLVNAGQICVYINESEVPARQRFTLAHELGHYFIHNSGEHVALQAPVAMARNTLSSQGVLSREIEANQFAAELLMPRKMICEVLRTEGYGEFLDENDILRLAKRFEVSNRAMAIRLGSLGFFR